MKKTGFFCIALVGMLAVSAVIAGAHQFTNPAYAVVTPCGDIDTSGVTGNGSGGSGGSGGGSQSTIANVDETALLEEDVVVGVYDLTPAMVVNGANEYTTGQKTVQLDIDYRALTCIEIYDNGVLIATVPLTALGQWQNVKPTFDLTTEGTHNITVVGYDLNGNPMSARLEYKIVYEPGYGVPPTGVIKIGEMTLAQVDLITIIASVVVACGVFALLVVMQNKRREARNERRR